MFLGLPVRLKTNVMMVSLALLLSQSTPTKQENTALEH
jgi:hypothetical protein